MNLEKFSPWNWFKREQEETGRGELMPRTSSSHPMMRLHRDMDRLFEDFFSDFGWPQAAGDQLLRPSIDIAESKKAYRISVEVPGVEESDLALSVDGDALIISGEKRQDNEQEENGFHRVERRYGSFRRVLSLPDDADRDKISARFKNGVLHIKVPRSGKSRETGGKRIAIE